MKRTTIENDTPILPYVVADNVVREVACFLMEEEDVQLPVPQNYADMLAGKAERTYSKNRYFAKKIQGGGTKGLDHLYMFMRHWLYADLQRTQPEMTRMLPERFAVGGAI